MSISENLLKIYVAGFCPATNKCLCSYLVAHARVLGVLGWCLRKDLIPTYSGLTLSIAKSKESLIYNYWTHATLVTEPFHEKTNIVDSV